jgi:hypothetical protein
MPTTWSIRSSLGASLALKRSGFRIVATQESRNWAAATSQSSIVKIPAAT